MCIHKTFWRGEEILVYLYQINCILLDISVLLEKFTSTLVLLNLYLSSTLPLPDVYDCFSDGLPVTNR